MGLMTVKQYKDSLKDGRVVYYEGEKVADVTTHDSLKVCVDTAAVDYQMAEMEQFRDLAVVTNPQTKEPISRYYYTPKNSEDLLKRHELMVAATRFGSGVIPFSHDIGADAMNAVIITANMMGNKEYIKRAEKYHTLLQQKDLSVACAMSDVKGDRVLRPSSPKQGHADYYVHVVDRNDKGIVVRGAKAHITAAAYCNEILVIPCRNMEEADKDYAVAFAIPANTKGVIQVCHPVEHNRSSLDFPIDFPIRTHTDSLIIFDDVFVPWERVFLCGEWKFALPLVYNFAYLHRHTAASYRIPSAEGLVGAAVAMAEYNGIKDVPHIREEITELVIYCNTLKSLARASCIDFATHGGIPIPNPVLTNMAKYHFATNFHNSLKLVQDVAGGLLVTAPTYKDFQNPDIGEYIKKYLGGKAGVSAEARLRMFQLLRRMMQVYNEVVAVHAEGSFQAQRQMIYFESLKDMADYKKMVEFAAGITHQ
ncbi:MAG: 4-hydroxyphenylacetate 3-hydroxylase N-terminal domain-containing protein [Dehalococcoidia bacterium]